MEEILLQYVLKPIKTGLFRFTCMNFGFKVHANTGRTETSVGNVIMFFISLK